MYFVFAAYVIAKKKAQNVIFSKKNQQSSDNGSEAENSSDKNQVDDADDDAVYVGCCKRKSKAGHAARIMLFGISSYFFTVFLVLVSVFIILGASANPVVALSHTAFYITAFVCSWHSS